MAEDKSIKIKKKKWVSIVAPKQFGEDALGESYTASPSSLVGRTLSINLMALTNDVKQQNTNIKFLITGVEGDRAATEVISYSIATSSIRRLVRKSRVRIDMSFVCFTADKKRVRVKPFLLITTSTKGSAASALRKQAAEIVTNEISKTNYDDLIRDLIVHKLQKGLRDQLKKIFPLRACEIRELSIEKEKKPVENKPKRAEGKEAKADQKAETKEEAEEEPEAEEVGTEEKEAADKAEEPKAEKKKEAKEKKKPKTEEEEEEKQEKPEEEKEEVAVSE